MPSPTRSVRAVASVLAFACALAGASRARAEGTVAGKGGGDIVYLKNGGVVRGTIIDAVPERTARVQLATGEIATIPWADVDHIVTAAPPAPAPASAPPAGQGREEHKPQETIRLHVESPRDIEVVGRPSDGYEWAPVCGGACDRAVPADWEYQVRGDGVKASAPFLLKAPRGRRRPCASTRRPTVSSSWG